MLSMIFWSLWRRLYGEGKFKEILSRTVQTIIAVVVLAYQLCAEWTWQAVGIALLVAAWMVIQYWSRSVGEIIDAGLNPCQGRKDYDRWFRPICNLIVSCINWLFPCHIHKYYGVYDWIYSGMRNLVGVLPALFLYPSWLWVVLIICMYPIYRFCYWLFEVFPKLYNSTVLKYITLNEPKNVAEVIHGAVFGLIVGLV